MLPVALPNCSLILPLMSLTVPSNLSVVLDFMPLVSHAPPSLAVFKDSIS